MTEAPQQIQSLLKSFYNLTGNLEPLPAIIPGRMAPVVRTAADGERELVLMRWGFSAPVSSGLKTRNPYLTNISDFESKLWKTWLEKPAQRCLVPVTSFAMRINKARPRALTWFARDSSRPLMFFAGVWREWEGDLGTTTVSDFGKSLHFSILTTGASSDIAPVRPGATPVVLPDEAAREKWMTAPLAEAKLLQKPPPVRALRIVAKNVKEDRKHLDNRIKRFAVNGYTGLRPAPVA